MSKHEKSAVLKSPSTKTKSRAVRSPVSAPAAKSPIVIDSARDLVFTSEDELYDYFLPQIQALEKEYFNSRSNTDVQEKDFARYEFLLDRVLDEPDEIWEDAVSIYGMKVRAYVGHFALVRGGVEGAEPRTDHENQHKVEQIYEHVYYVALAYATGDVPSFVYLHFPSHDLRLVDQFRRGTLLYDRVIKEVEKGAVEGDALSEGDELAVGLYRAMLTLRSEGDVSEEIFKNYENLRELAIEEPDEIWRSVDLDGNVLVTFIKDFAGDDLDGDGGASDFAARNSTSSRFANTPIETRLDFADLRYVVVTIEDTPSNSHALLFSFPTKDASLVGRYRHGENLQAEEVVQEGSH